MKLHGKVTAIAVACVTLIAATTQFTAPDARAVSYPTFGVTYHGFWNYKNDTERQIALQKMKDAGVKWVRIDMGWATVEEARDVYSSWSLDLYDAVVNQASNMGFNVLLTVQNTPNWAHSSTDETMPPDDPDELGEFMKDMSNRYGEKVQAMEIWNEPNNSEFFNAATPGNEAQEFFTMASTAYDWVKQNGDASDIVFPGGSVYVDDKWWSQLYELGIKDYSDVIAVNPYQAVADESPLEPDQGNKWRMQHLPALLEVMKANGDANKPVWFTEFGWSVHDSYSSNNWEQPVTEAEQALYLQQTLDLVASDYPQVQNVFWYNLRSRGADQMHINNFGLLNNDLTERESYRTLKAMLVPGEQSATPDATPVEPVNGTGAQSADSSGANRAANQDDRARLADTGDSIAILALCAVASLALAVAVAYRRAA